MTHPVAAIDCGTNSIRLLVARSDGSGGLVDLDRRLELVRLGQGVDATRQFQPDALARTFAACERFAEVIDRFDCGSVRFVGTSATRDVTNRDEFVDGVSARLGVEPEIVPGTEEARLSFVGASSGVPDAPEPVLVVDLGGGSTELVVGRSGQVVASISLDMGSVRVRERYLAGDPPAEAEVEAAREFIGSLFDGSGIDLAGVRSVIGVAGTITSLSAIHQGLSTYDRARVHRSRLTRAEIEEVTEYLLHATVAQVLEDTCLQPRRAEVIVGGALICRELIRRTGPDFLTVSEADILDGIALGMLGEDPTRA